MARMTKKNNLTSISMSYSKPDINLSAQTNKVLQLIDSDLSEFLKVARQFILNEKNFIIDRIVMMLLSTYGLRISEVLDIKTIDILESGIILIRSKKGSEPRIVSGHIFSEWLIENKLHFVSLLQFRNRWFYYRLFKRLGIYKIMTGNTNASTTHVFRYQFISDITKLSHDITTTQKIVGHKSLLNTIRYEQKNKK